MTPVTHTREFTSRQLTTVMLALVKERIRHQRDLQDLSPLDPLYSPIQQRIFDLDDALLAIEPHKKGG